MAEPRFEVAKIKAVILYIIGKTGTIDFHKFFKILYFAEQFHLVKYGRKIVDDSYVAMPYGPVASVIFDVFNEKRHGLPYPIEHATILNSIAIDKFRVSTNELPDIEELSISDIKCLDMSIGQNVHLSMDELTKKSHQFAWLKAKGKSNSNCNRIDDIDIAIEGGAKPGMLQYISEANQISLRL
jgi:uncharacterized phage-associated protein